MSLILAVLKAFAVIPALKELWDEFVAWYVELCISKMSEQHRTAIRTALERYDQRPIEEAIGNPGAGEPSGVPGSIITDKPPAGVRP